MAELADALDLESSSHGVQVRFLLPAPDLILNSLSVKNKKRMISIYQPFYFLFEFYITKGVIL